MTTGDEFEAVLEAVSRYLQDYQKGDLSSLQKELLQVLWRQPKLSYSAVVDELRRQSYAKVKTGHLRNVAAALWKTVGTIVETKVSKDNVIDELQRWYKQTQAHYSSPLHGRDRDSLRLMQALQNPHHRVICVTGMPRIGKTELVYSVINQLQQQRQAAASETSDAPPIHWHLAAEVPTVRHLYEKVYQRIHRSKPSADQLEDPTVSLRTVLEQPLLLVINDADVLYDAERLSGLFQSGSGYVQLLIQVIQDPTLQGRIIWVSQVAPWCLETRQTTLHHFEVSALSKEGARSLLRSRAHGTQPSDWQPLIQFCGGNPGLLLAAAQKVHDVFDGSIRQFLKTPLRGNSQEDNLWRKAIDAISTDEKVLMIWLMLRPLTYQAILQLAIPHLPEQKRVNALRSLQRRGLVRGQTAVANTGKRLYDLHPPYLRYALADWLAHRISQQLAEKDMGLLLQYPLTRPLDPAWNRRWHYQYILEPLAKSLGTGAYWSRSAQSQLLAKLMSQIPPESDEKIRYSTGYRMGNLLNIAVALGIPLAEFTIAGSTIRCADLRKAQFAGVKATGCQFDPTTILPLVFKGRLVADMSADGNAIVVGDTEGRIGCWVRADEHFQLDQYYRFRPVGEQPAAINAIAIDTQKVVVISVNNEIYRWWIEGNHQPIKQWGIASEVRYLAQSGDAIAAGLADGGVCVYDRVTMVAGQCRTHTGPVSVLSFDAEGESVASVGHGNRLLHWDVMDLPDLTIQDDLPSDGRILLAAQWRSAALLLAGTLDGCPSIKLGEDPWRNFQTVQGVTKLSFSRNGTCLIGLDSRGNLYRWDQALEEVQSMAALNIHPNIVRLDNTGDSLLTVCSGDNSRQTDACVQLWEVPTGRLIWEIEADAPPMTGVSLDQVAGLSTATLQHLREFSAEI
ncbi:MAG: hypothetical protein AAFW75_09990 [Cyanobacteria bacterium J06636_16]